MIEGYSISIHRSLTEPLLMAGAPRGIAIINKPVKPAALRAVLSQRKAALRRTGQAAE